MPDSEVAEALRILRRNGIDAAKAFELLVVLKDEYPALQLYYGHLMCRYCFEHAPYQEPDARNHTQSCVWFYEIRPFLEKIVQ